MTLDVSRLRDLAMSDSGFVFDPVTGRTYTLNETALVALRALKAGELPEAVAARLRDSFDVGEDEDVAADVEELLARLREQGLVQ
jgi:PqqD family protein of HPr-rel-A system